MATSTAPHPNSAPAFVRLAPDQVYAEKEAIPVASDLRFERKFAVTQMAPRAIEAALKLNPALFSSIYQTRFVNNIYLDTPLRQAYHDTLAGAADRKKVRIRWYGDLTGAIHQPVLEFKIKKGLAGYKISTPLMPFKLDEDFTEDTLKDLFERSKLSDAMRPHLLQLEPALVNRYTRSYFLSADKRFRATLDIQLSFYSISNRRNRFLHRHSETGLSVLELKYACDDDRDAGRISSAFPFRLSRSSKYTLGITRLAV